MANAQGIMAGRAFVQLFADDAALQKGLASAEKQVKAFGVSVGKIGAAIGGLGALITAPLIAATNLFAESGSQLAHMAERTGMSVEALSTLGYAAKQSGTDLESVEVAVKRLQKAMTAGSLENQQAAQTFANLGLNVQQLMRLKPDEQFNLVAKRLADVRNPAARAGASMMLFGRSGTALLPLIEHLGALSKEAKDFGLVTSTEAAEGALKLEHSMKLLDAISRKIVTTIGSALAPMFERWNTKLAKVEKSVLDLVKANKPLVVTIAQVGFALVAAGTAITALGVVIFGFGQIIVAVSAVIGVIYSALLLLTTPLGLIAVGFVATTTAMGAWGQAGEAVKNVFSGFPDILKGMSDAFKANDLALAAQVMFAGLNLEFLKGTTKLSKLWNDWGVSLVEGFRKTNFDIASGLLALESFADAARQRIKEGGEKGGAAGTVAEIGKLIMPPSAYDVVARAGGAPDTQDILKGVLTGKAPEVGTAPSKEMQAIITQFAEAQKALRSAQTIEEENRRKASADQLAAAQKELAAAQAQFDKIKGKAAEKAREPEAFGEGGQGGKGLGGGPMTPEGLDKGLKEAASKVDVTGTFSAAAAAGQGIGQSIEKEHLDESKKQTAELEKIKKNTAAKQVFAT